MVVPEKPQERQKIDVYRDTPVRFLGYANEVGEAFRGIIGSKLVWASYGVATAYGAADTLDKSIRMYRKSDDDTRAKKTLIIATDTFLWQMLASVVIPGFIINRICSMSGEALRKRHVPQSMSKWIVPIVGLSSIPLIVRPIDHFSDFILDCTFRKFGPRG